uniref:Uncharacterized protein n=1 Tax=Tanacetum cinerariifolium TaxID=118510 RepID=A0A6L2MIV4_TANCI|nr:hypothetical protein [Tanacetum cinerariifolium]
MEHTLTQLCDIDPMRDDIKHQRMEHTLTQLCDIDPMLDDIKKQSGYNILRAVGLWRLKDVLKMKLPKRRVNVLEWHPLLEL